MVESRTAGSAPRPSPVGRAVRKVKRHWTRKGPLATFKAIAATLASPVFRTRQRLVFDIELTSPRDPSEWGPGESLLVFGRDNISSFPPKLLETLEPEKHQTELQGVPGGNWLFVVACEDRCIYRSYIRMLDTPGLDRKSVFFGGLQALPEIRQAVIRTSFRGKDLHSQIRRGLHTRVVNEQLRLLHSLGHNRAVLYIMAGNVLSIKANTAAGFRPLRTLDDWILFDTIVLQRNLEGGRCRWRFFLQ